MTLSQEFPCHIKLLSPLSFLFLFLCSLFLFFVVVSCFSVVWLLFSCRCIMNGRNYLKWTDFHVGKILVRFSFANENLNMLHVKAFANTFQNIQFWPNYQILREFDFEKLLKICKFSNLLNAKIISIEVNC